AIFLVYSFFRVDGARLVAEPGLQNYRRFFTDAIYLPVFLRTCVLCLEVAGLTLLLGYPVAYLLAALRGRKKYVLLLLLVVPLLMSYIIKIYAIRSILGGTGFLNRALMWLGVIDQPSMLFVFNLNAVLLTLTVLLLPFAILPIFLSLERIPRGLIEAAADLGGTAAHTFLLVVLPLSLPGVIAATTFVFVLALGDFLTPLMVGGQSGFTFGRIIYSQFGTAFNWPFGAALSMILAAAVMATIALGAWLGGRGAAWRGGPP
ncbi:MAG: ABC transporter permease, partial [Rhodospirillaceae bacterium]|nr:ABC transporter permease [Rhodospirillaceae bacterium]